VRWWPSPVRGFYGRRFKHNAPMTSRGKITFAVAGITICAASPAHAHLMNTGFGPFYDGLAHLFVSPEDLLPVIALALLAGLRGPRPSRAVLLILPVAWLAGVFMQVSSDLTVAAVALTITLGGLVAADRHLPEWLVIGCALVLGLLQGSLNGTEWIGFSIVGNAVALFVVVALLAGQVTALRSAWARIVVRVAGSWIAAIGLLMLGWLLRSTQ